jgi:hypothetical protein
MDDVHCTRLQNQHTGMTNNIKEIENKYANGIVVRGEEKLKKTERTYPL